MVSTRSLKVLLCATAETITASNLSQASVRTLQTAGPLYRAESDPGVLQERYLAPTSSGPRRSRTPQPRRPQPVYKTPLEAMRLQRGLRR